MQIYRKIKSNFTLGLIIFTIALLLQSISRAVLLLLVITNGPPTVYPLIIQLLGYNPVYVVIPDALEFISLSILLYFTRQ
jgi:hypothetical protein